MRKTALAVAVGGLFIAPAAQAQIIFGNETLGTLQLYGKLYPQFSYATSKDPTPVRKRRLRRVRCDWRVRHEYAGPAPRGRHAELLHRLPR